MKISNLLPTDQESALSYRELSQITGLSHRELRDAIRRERRQGVAILTSHQRGRSGVWLWSGQDPEELMKCYRMLLRTGSDILQTAALMKKAACGEVDRF